MKAAPILALAAALAWCGGATALPMRPGAPSLSGVDIVPAQLVCGPYRCFRRPVWRYGDGVGFRPYRRLGPVPLRRFGYRPFGFGRFGGGRR